MTLPPAAALKLRQLEAAALDGRALAQSAKELSERLEIDRANLVNRRKFHLGQRQQEQADALAGDIAKLDKELATARAEQFSRQDQAAAAGRTLTQVAQWINNLRHDRVLEPVEIEPVASKRGEALGDVVLRLRRKVLDLKHEAEETEAAALPAPELKARARAHLAELKAEAAIKIDFQTGRIETPPAHLVLGLIACAIPGAVQLQLDRMIDAIPAVSSGIGADEKAKRLSDLKRELDHAERQEEAAIVAAISAGVNVHRRPDAGPAAVLGVKVTKAAKALAA